MPRAMVIGYVASIRVVYGGRYPLQAAATVGFIASIAGYAAGIAGILQASCQANALSRLKRPRKGWCSRRAS